MVLLRNVLLWVSILGMGLWAQPKKDWKDRQEFDLFESARKETDPAKKLAFLNSWKEKYPETDFRQERLTLYISAYQQAGQAPKIYETAKELVALDPKDLTGLYWLCTLTPNLGSNGPDIQATGEKAANGLLASLDTNFAPEKKPKETSDADWKKGRDTMEALAHKTLGWVAMQRKNNDVAETELVKSLQIDPASGEVSYWMYTTLRAMGKVERFSDALFHLARAASYDKQGALQPAARRQIDDFFRKAYASYHEHLADGREACPDPEGMKKLRELATGANPLPPQGFKIDSCAEVVAHKEEEERKLHPQRAFWMNLKKELTGPNGQAFFDSMKGAVLPGAIPNTEHTKLKGTVVSQSPARNPKTLVLGIENPKVAEVTLKITDGALAGKADPGTEIEFEGVADAFTKEPFMVTFNVERTNIVGWPAQQAAPAPTKKSGSVGGRKGVVRKK